jgi:hypothetical protein
MSIPTSITYPAPRPSFVLPGMVAAAWLVVAGILLQFLFAGLAMFQDASTWPCHVGLGFGLAVLILGMTIAAFLSRKLVPARAWLVALALAYFVQICLIWVAKSRGLSLPQALHPFNGSLILVIALILAMKLSRPAVTPLTAR